MIQSLRIFSITHVAYKMMDVKTRRIHETITYLSIVYRLGSYYHNNECPKFLH